MWSRKPSAKQGAGIFQAWAWHCPSFAVVGNDTCVRQSDALLWGPLLWGPRVRSPRRCALRVRIAVPLLLKFWVWGNVSQRGVNVSRALSLGLSLVMGNDTQWHKQRPDPFRPGCPQGAVSFCSSTYRCALLGVQLPGQPMLEAMSAMRESEQVQRTWTTALALISRAKIPSPGLEPGSLGREPSILTG